MSREEQQLDKAVTQLLGVNTKLGVLAGLALVAKKQQELHSEEEDSPTADKLRESTSRRAQRRNGSAHVAVSGNDTSGGAAGGGSVSSSAAAAARAKQSVHDQRDVIRKLHEQNQILKQELSIEYRDAKLMLSHEKRQQLGRLQKMAATFARKIDLVKKNAARVDELLAKKTQELEGIRQQQQQHGESGNKSGGDASTTSGSPSSEVGNSGSSSGAIVPTESPAANTRRLRALENRLELALVKKNEMDSINKHLRAQIEKVRKDRAIFDGIYKKLEKEMSEYRQRHELSVEELKKAVDAKLQVSAEIVRIQTRAEREQRSYEQQFQKLKASIETSMREAARLSGGAGGGADLVTSPLAYTSHKVDAHSDAAESPTLGSSTKDSPLNRISVLSSWKIGYDRALATTSESVTTKYEKAFAGIRAMTGIRDIAKIAEEIVNRDEANFKRFKRVEELHQEEAALHSQIDELALQVEEFKAQEGIATSASQKHQLRATSDTLRQALEKSKEYDNEFEDTTATLARIRSSVHSIHSMLAHANCARNVDKFSEGSAHLALGSHSARDVTDANVLEYLQAIETFATSLMKETHEAAAMAAGVTESLVPSGTAAENSEPLPVPSSSSTHPGSHAAASSSSPIHSDAAAPSPIGHGPLTLPSDPSQKLRVQVPSVGGVNGVIVVPASSPFRSENDAADDRRSRSLRSSSKNLHQHHHHQQLHLHQGLQRRKSGGRFETMARKSLSQVQFAAALAAAAESDGETPLALPHHPKHPHSLAESASGGGGANTLGSNFVSSAGISGTCDDNSDGTAAQREMTRVKLEEEEEERALTYDELRQFAAKNVVKKKSDDASLTSNPSALATTTAPGASEGAARGRQAPE